MILAIMFIPRMVMLVSGKFKLLKTIGPVFICYVTGFLLSTPFKNAGADITLAADFSSVLVLIGMPLILFSANLPALKKLAKPMIISFVMNTAAVLIVAVGSFFIFKYTLPNSHNISGMLVGTNTGGTPNMIAI